MSSSGKKFFQRTIRIAIVIALAMFAFIAFGRNTANAQTGLKVQYLNADANASDNQIKPHISIVNGSAAAVALNTVKVRYYFTGDAGATTYSVWCDYSPVGCPTGAVVTLSPTAATADRYLELSFSSGSIAAGGSTGVIQNRFNKTDWSNFSETNDYSYGTNTALADKTTVTLYVNGTLVWGTPPGGTGPTVPPPTVGATATKTKTPVPPTVGGPTATKTKTPIPPTVGGPTATKTKTPLPPTIQPPTNTPFPGATATKTKTPVPPTVGPTATNPPNGTHLANPFAGASWYVNVDYAAEVVAEANLQSGTLKTNMLKVANIPTFVWLDSIDAVNGTNGYGHSLAGHMDAALAAGKNTIGIVVYDLPNRDCSALASNGELLIAQDGFNKYKTLYIDAIYATISQAKYANMRIIAVIEPDSLPNLITNLSFAKCTEANGTGGYRQATQYTLTKLHALSRFYAYIDIGHAGWLGWPNNFGPTVTLIGDTITGSGQGANSVDGFISNTANTSVGVEPYMTANQTVGGGPVRSANFYQWNDYIDEAAYDTAWKAAMTAKGIPSNMLIDTSRNGWGGCGGGAFVSQQCRPTAASTSTDLNTFVNATRTDRRPGKGDWCNQDGAGVGFVPSGAPGAPAPAAPFQAYVWVKPPGESDGSSTLVPTGPDNPGGKGFDRMCDPTYGGNALNNNVMTNALAGAPVSGRWFKAQFIQLVTNAFPAIP